MHFISETSSNGVIERNFTLGDITGVLWSSASSSAGAPLILSGHTGGIHKKAPGLVANAHRLVTGNGYTVAAIDAPGHGDRPRDAEDEAARAGFARAHENGDPMGPLITEYNTSLAQRAVPEWQATIDALQALPEIGPDAPIGYGGMTLGVAIGLMLTAVEPRIRAASYGPVFTYEALIDAAKQITIPVEFTIAWDDEGIPREPGLALFDACASPEKSLHVYPGRHNRMLGVDPDAQSRFFARHLGGVA
ncbi:dienelactone hydrolase family protein [Nocardia sp. NPDC020380]|uniref:dienelactone hydrolase family protein n=1 Tax=Nocardia sp. NPDC020380 TaxID=3364309 RepID=UPI00378FB8A5